MVLAVIEVVEDKVVAFLSEVIELVVIVVVVVVGKIYFGTVAVGNQHSCSGIENYNLLGMGIVVLGAGIEAVGTGNHVVDYPAWVALAVDNIVPDYLDNAVVA